MTTNPYPAGSDDWWLHRLADALDRRRPHFEMLDAYMCGTQGIPINASRATRDAYRRLAAMARTNYAELIVEAVRERMVPLGFRTGADGDELGDREAWRIWQANAMDADHAILDRMVLAFGIAYAIVGAGDGEMPVVTVEDPRQVVTQQDPANRRRTLAGLKVHVDDVSGEDVAQLFLPSRMMEARRDHRIDGPAAHGAEWKWVSRISTGVDVVPVVPFVYRPASIGAASPGIAEIEPHLAILDRINYTLLSRLEAVTMQAFRQRAIKGLPLLDADGRDVDYDDVFSADPGALWQLPATAEMWESGLIDLTPILESVRADVRDLAAVTRTPMTYLFPDAAGQSAEGASLMREGLVFKVADRIAQAGESYEQLMALAFAFLADVERSSRADMEVIWATPERFSLAEKASAAAQAAAAGMPWRTIMSEIWQFSPQQIDRMESERMTDVLLGDFGGADEIAS